MAKFNRGLVRAPINGPVVSTPGGYTYEGAQGTTRDAKSELFLLAISSFAGEDTFYESGDSRTARLRDLVKSVAAEDPAWIVRLFPWVRQTLNLRSVALVGAAEYVAAGGLEPRGLVATVCQRADEPGELLAYWIANYGRKLPAGLKRGLSDAALRLYTPRNILRYDSQKSAVRMGDVIEMTHPNHPHAKYLIDKRHGRENPRTEEIALIIDGELLAAPDSERRALLGRALEYGWSWERVAGWLPGGMDSSAWEACIPHMGYMALLRNLRNFDDAKVSDEAAVDVINRLSDTDEVGRSRQLPIRFYSAFKEAGLRWAWALERALGHSMSRVPALPGKTLVLVDLSGSMNDTMSARSKRTRFEIASLFAGALYHADRDDVRVIAYSDEAAEVVGTPDILTTMDRIVRAVRHGGTHTFEALHAAYRGEGRVIIITDEQAHDEGHGLPDVPIYTFNLAGYKQGHLVTGRNRTTIGGLSDACFPLIPLLERASSADWPF